MSGFKIIDFQCKDCSHKFDLVTKKAAPELVESEVCPQCSGPIQEINCFQSGRAPTSRVQWVWYDTANQRPFDSKQKMTENLKKQGLELVT